jgi:hypothetical protein
MTQQQSNPPASELGALDRDKRLARARRYLEAYGGDRARWPEHAVALFDKFAGDYRFEVAREDAATLDEALSASPSEPARETLKDEILARFEAKPARPSLFGGSQARTGFGRFVPAGALAGLTALGFVAGAASATVTMAGADDEVLYYASATLGDALEEEALWAQE